MIRPLRSVHRTLFAILALLLPALVVLALRARIPEPHVTRLPAVVPATPGTTP